MTESSDLEELLALRRLRYQSPGDYLLRHVGERNRDRLIAAIDNGVPVEGLVVAGRWWQLETYLRLLVYIQLRALFGSAWQQQLRARVARRMTDAEFLGYMSSADDNYPLAHVDVHDLFTFLTDHWEQCAHGIGLPKKVWEGRVAEVIPIRHRIAHCRRPHSDDIDRIEQLLRDLEPGANQALRAYTDWREPAEELPDPLVRDWSGRRHPDAALVDHGHKNKGIHFTLMASRLPWAETAVDISGSPGWFWVMHVVLHDRYMHIDDYWRQPAVQTLLPIAVHIIQPGTTQLVVTFPAVDEPPTISDAIAGYFEAVFGASRPGYAEAVRSPSRRTQSEFDPRVDAEGLLSVVSELNPEDPITIFSAR